ncbi:MAG TPA: hypothetical protein PKN33_14235 [Phycisphaerae bacterium]|nr:hypothetical protein [Phycisphaerae bacterium]
MTKLVARLILAMLILPVAGAVFLFMAFAIFGNTGPPSALSLSLMWLVEYAVIGTYWVLLWRSTVRWTRERLLGTFGVTLAALLCGGIGAGFIVEVSHEDIALGILVGGGLVPIVWVFGTVLVWKETSQERFERVKSYGTDTVSCPVCGYNMTGLKEARCPECGGSFTVDELLTAQQNREEELEQS